MNARVEAVLFDLDDTLYLQERWLAGAWRAVATEATRHGIDFDGLLDALQRVAAHGSDRGHIIDRAVSQVGAPASAVAPLVAAFRAYRAPALEPFEGVVDALARLRTRLPIALVSDGDVELQRSKIDALGMTTAFDVVVLSDTLGRECRKPHPAPFRAALDLLEVDVDAAVFVGDRPDKDVMGAVGVGMRVVRVRTGEYRAQPDLVGTWASVPDVVAAIELVERMPLVRGATRAGPASVAGTGRGPGR